MIEKQSNPILIMALTLALCAYFLPWVSHPSASLTMGAYDLAEWLNLHPLTQPDRIPGLLLRSQLLLFTLVVAFWSAQPRFTKHWWVRMIGIMLLCIAQLPPPEFIEWTGDLNQRQQALLAIMSALGGTFGLAGFMKRYHQQILYGICMIGIITTGYILVILPKLMATFELSKNQGLGGYMLIGVYVGMIFFIRQSNADKGI